MNEVCCVLIFGVIVIFATLGVIFWCYHNSDGFTNVKKLKEHFSPTGWTRDCPYYGDIPSTECGPGCYTTSNLGIKGCRRKVSKPTLKRLPLGWGGTMTGPYAGSSGCASNVNGVMKNSKRNPYGIVGPQMYGMCVMGSDNAFENVE